jgi:flavorubredoxin
MQAPQARIDRIAQDTWRISVAMPPELIPGGFSFNQYLVVDDKPLLFHTGPRRLFGLVRAQIESVLPVSRLRYLAFSHFEADECGSLAEFLELAPQAQPVCDRVAAMVSVSDQVDREVVAMEDGQVLDLGRHQLVWQSTPHLPHGWECGYFFDRTTGTLFCGDLFTQPGTGGAPLTEDDILAPSETFRRQDDYFSQSRRTPALIEKLAQLQPRLLACMHGSAWRGDGATMLRRLGQALAA